MSLMLVLPTMFGSASAQTENKLFRIVVANQPSNVTSQGIVTHEGYFTEVNGIPVEYKDFNSGADVYRAMASGAVDMGLIGNAPFTIAVSQGAEYTAVWWYVVGLTAEGLVVRDASSIEAVADLKGQRVATPFGSTSDFMLHGTIDTAGLNAREVRLVNLAPQAILAAWQRGDLDAAYIWEPVFGQLVKQGGKIIATNKDLLQHGYLAGDVGFVKTSLLKEHPDIVKAWMRANMRAVDLIRSEPDKAVEIAAKAYGVTVDDIKTTFAGVLFPTAAEQLGPEYLAGLGEQMSKIAALLAASKLIPGAAAPEVYKSAVSVEPLKDAMAP